MTRAIRVFVSYSRQDAMWLDDTGPHGLVPWLAEALQTQDVSFWSDPRMQERPGTEYRVEIEREIDQAHIAVLLISQDFLISEFIRTVELPRIKACLDRGDLLIVPVLVGHVAREWPEDFRWLLDRQIVPSRMQPLIDCVSDQAKWQRVRIEVLEAVRRTVLRAREPQRTQGRGGPEVSERPSVDGQETGRPTTLRRRRKPLSLIGSLVALLSLGIIGYAVFQMNWASAPTVAISEPRPRAFVDRELVVQGTASKAASVVVLVHPVGTDGFWVQAPATFVGQAAWETRVVVGEPGARDRGREFEVRAFANPRKPLREGQTLGAWPDAGARSTVVVVVRR